MSILTSERLESIAALADAATPGPWEWDSTGFGCIARAKDGAVLQSGFLLRSLTQEQLNIIFAAAARTAVPELVAHAKAMDAKLATAQARILEVERVIIDARICLTAQNYAGAEGKLDEAKI